MNSTISNATIANQMTVEIARSLKSYKNVFHGLASPLPMISIQLAKLMYNEELEYLNITGGVNVIPEVQSKSTDGYNLFKGTKSIFNLTDIFDLAARGKLDVAFLSGVQIDKTAHVNNSVIGDYHKPKVRLPGGAGSAVLLPNVKNAFIWRTKHDRKTFVENVDFITSQGNIKYVFTPLCTFEKVNGTLKVIRIAPYTTLEEIQNNTGFELIYDTIDIAEEPTANELKMLTHIDPDMIRAIEF